MIELDEFNYPTLYSVCCGANDRIIAMDDGTSYAEIGLCPQCREHTEFVTADKLEFA